MEFAELGEHCLKNIARPIRVMTSRRVVRQIFAQQQVSQER
jgi:hypothetical protein